MQVPPNESNWKQLLWWKCKNCDDLNAKKIIEFKGVSSYLKKTSSWQIGKDPLHVAAEKGSDKTLALMLDKGARINSKSSDEDGSRSYTALHVAVKHTKVSTVKLLLDRGADRKIRGVCAKKSAQELYLNGTPLDWAKTVKENVSQNGANWTDQATEIIKLLEKK